MRFLTACAALVLSTGTVSSQVEMRRGFEAKLMGSGDVTFRHPQFALVTDVYCNSSAKRAGLRKNDVLRKIDGRVVEEMTGTEFLVAIARLEQIPWVILTVRRATEDGAIEKVIHYPPRSGGEECPPEQDT